MEDKKEQAQRKKPLLPTLLFLVVVLFVISSGMLGFILGRSASGSQGQLIDTIVISPEMGKETSGETTHFLSGRVLYAEGSPCAGVTVRLVGEAKTDETDENGKFFFSDIRGGSTTVEVLDSEGTLLADTPVTFEFEKDGGVQADVTVPAFQLPADARMVELTLTVNPEAGSLVFQEDAGYVVTADGDVIDFEGGMLQSGETSYSVIPGGDVVSATGYTAIPSHQVVILPEGAVVQAEDLTEEEKEEAGLELKGQGVVQLKNPAALVQDGQIILEGKDPIGPGQNVIAVSGGTVEELPQLPDSYDPPSPAASQESPSPEALPSQPSAGEESSAASPVPAETPSSALEPESSSTQPEEEPSPAPSGDPAPDGDEIEAAAGPTPTPTPDPLTVNHMQENDGEWQVGQTWKQQSVVDLFKNRTTGQEYGETEITRPDGSKETVPIIAPGSSGFYEFQLKNDADYSIRFTLSIAEQSFHLPILYSVQDLENGYMYQGGGKVNPDGSAISTGYIILPPHSQRRYKLGWEWQYEDWLNAEEDDIYDTLGGMDDGRTYMISVWINAEEMRDTITPPSYHGEGTRYPGQTKY